MWLATRTPLFDFFGSQSCERRDQVFIRKARAILRLVISVIAYQCLIDVEPGWGVAVDAAPAAACGARAVLVREDAASSAPLPPRSTDHLRAERFLDPENLVPFRHALGSRERSDFQLTGVPSDGEVRNREVLRLPRARRDDGTKPGAASHLAGRKGLADRSCLIHFEKHGVDGSRCCRLLHEIGIGDEIVITDHLNAITDGCRKAASMRKNSPLIGSSTRTSGLRSLRSQQKLCVAVPMSSSRLHPHRHKACITPSRTMRAFFFRFFRAFPPAPIRDISHDRD
ncbi:hypothetical protein ACVMDN_001518 [Bradyrhizobium sp. USDA 4510]